MSLADTYAAYQVVQHLLSNNLLGAYPTPAQKEGEMRRVQKLSDAETKLRIRLYQELNEYVASL